MSVRWQQIRTSAGDIRAWYFTRLGNKDNGRLDLDELVESLYQLTAFEDPMLDPRIEGELNAVIGSIRLRPRLPQHRQRFVIAHELGHYVLENAASFIFQDNETTLDERGGSDINAEVSAVRIYNTRERHEQEANLFALELLLPAAMLWQRVQEPGWTVEELAFSFDVSLDMVRMQLVNVCCLEPITSSKDAAVHRHRPIMPNVEQQAAVAAPMPTLVIAGPGTGKTRSIVAKYLSLVEQGIDPANILCLTFSNKAAEEMRLRIIAAMEQAFRDQAGKVEISTFHAWGLNTIKTYGHHLGLPIDIRLLDTGDLFVLLKNRLSELPLHEYKMLHDPAYYLSDIIQAISKAKDELCSPEEYRRLAEADGQHLIISTEAAQRGKTTKTAQGERDKASKSADRLLELANIYACYEAILRDEGVLDYGDLIVKTAELLKLDTVAAALQAQYQYILVDEFQDINYASGVMVARLDGGRGRVWAVGDPWQSIYRFRGASPANLQEFPIIYAETTTVQLSINYRSLQPILDASHAIMEPDPLFGTRAAQRAWQQSSESHINVQEWELSDPTAEAQYIAHSILRRVRGRLYRTMHCAHIVPIRLRPYVGLRTNHLRRRWRYSDHAILCRTHSHASRIVASLEAHGIPVDWVGNIYDQPEVKDVLAICGMVRRAEDVGTLRALTIPEHALGQADLQILVAAAAQNKRSLRWATREPAIIAKLSEQGQAVLGTIHYIVEELAKEQDVWQVITSYLYNSSQAMRIRIRRANKGDYEARRELATLGHLISVARTFVRQAPPHERTTRDFISYIRILIEAGVAIKPSSIAGQADAVRVMTIHSAKGLEFPIVYIPALQKDQFPSRNFGSAIPKLPAMEHAPPIDELQEERYLLYVAMTRAQRRLILTRAVKQRDKPVERSALLQPVGVDTGLWPIKLKILRRLCYQPEPLNRLSIMASAVRFPIAASSVDTYKQCPRRYFYQYGYHLYDDTSPYLRMHQSIGDAIKELSIQAQERTLIRTEEELHTLLWQVFAQHELHDVLYSKDYFNEALRHVRYTWEALQQGAITPDAVNQPFIVPRPAGEIIGRVDRIELDEAGAHWVRIRSGREGRDDHLDTRMIIYALGYEELHKQPGIISIHYTSTGRRNPVKHRSDTLKNHVDQLDTTLEQIRKSYWSPKPGQHCSTCAFRLICPV
jgi:DNA helicase II / ATP-dependent DNA helicase PcrA